MYRCLKNNVFEDEEGYCLLAIRPEDKDLIRAWRNAQIDVLRQKHLLTEEEQDHYFNTVVKPDFDKIRPGQIIFSFLYNNRLIGYGGLVHIDWQASRAEVSFLVNPERAENRKCLQNDFFRFLSILQEAAFSDLKLNRLCTETFAFREDHIEVMEKIGFRKEGILRDHVYKKGRYYDSVLHGLLRKDTMRKSLKFVDSSKYAAVLITSVSKKVPLVLAVRDAINKSERFNYLHGCDSDSNCIARYALDSFWHCSALDEMSIETVLSYCAEYHIQAIIPTRDEDVRFYAKYRDVLKNQGIHVMGSTYEAVNRCQDKQIFADELGSGGFPVIPTYRSIEDSDSIQIFRYVVKERFGSGSKKIGLNLSKDEASRHAEKLSDPIFQPYISGIEWSVDVYRNLRGESIGCISRQRNLIVDGESQITTTKSYPILESLCTEAANELGLYAHAIFQVIEDERGRFQIIECNPRFGGGSCASISMGLDSFFWFLSESSGTSINNSVFKRVESEVRLVRHPADWVFQWLYYSI